MSILALTYLCLALNVYHEAGVDPIEGQLAVALVTVNRAREQKKEVCQIVFQPKQFSWTNTIKDKTDKLNPNITPKGLSWRQAKNVSKAVLGGKITDFTQGATHFHANYIKKPSWTKNMTLQGKWGTHYFYKRKSN